MSKDYGIENRAREQARTLGLSHEEVMSFVRQSARFTHPDFNRRYEGYLFKVDRRTVTDIGLFQDNDPRKRLREAGLPPRVRELLERCHAFCESLVQEAEDHWDDGDLALLEELIDNLEPYKETQG